MPKSKTRKGRRSPPHVQGEKVLGVHSKHPDAQVTRCGLGAGKLATQMSDITCRKCFIRTAMELEKLTSKKATELWNEVQRIKRERSEHAR